MKQADRVGRTATMVDTAHKLRIELLQYGKLNLDNFTLK
jgi:hypothetical protein